MRTMQYFENEHFMGIEISSVNDAMKAKEIGLDLISEDGDVFGYDVEDEDGNERPMTDEELCQDILKTFELGGKVYAGSYLDSETVVTDRKATMLLSDFFVGQQVYIMHENKICELYVQQVILASTYAPDKSSIPEDRGISVTAKDAIKRHNEIGVAERYVYENKVQNLLLLAKKETWKYQPSIGVKGGFAYHTFGIYPTDEVFTSKEELVKHLMED